MRRREPKERTGYSHPRPRIAWRLRGKHGVASRRAAPRRVVLFFVPRPHRRRPQQAAVHRVAPAPSRPHRSIIGPATAARHRRRRRRHPRPRTGARSRSKVKRFSAFASDATWPPVATDSIGLVRHTYYFYLGTIALFRHLDVSDKVLPSSCCSSLFLTIFIPGATLTLK